MAADTKIGSLGNVNKTPADSKFGTGIKDSGKSGGSNVSPTLSGADDDTLIEDCGTSGKLVKPTLPGAEDFSLIK